jgi:hypothetical protein
MTDSIFLKYIQTIVWGQIRFAELMRNSQGIKEHQIMDLLCYDIFDNKELLCIYVLFEQIFALARL